MNKKIWLPAAAVLGGLIIVTVWLFGGPSRASAITVQDLKIDAGVFPELDRVEVQAEVIDRDPANANAPGMFLMLRDLGIRSTGNYKLWLRAEPHPVIVKTRINVFFDSQRASAELANRYGPEARAIATPLTLGDDAFEMNGRAVLRIDHVLVEFTMKGAPEKLRALASAYARFIEAKLG